MINFSLIIPNYNGADLLLDCLNSIKNNQYKNIEIILVDNASTDKSIALSQQIFPKIKIIKNNTNQGFAAAINQGIQKAKYDWVVPCNNDIKLSPNWFKIMSQAIKSHPKIATFFGTVLNHDGTLIESQGLQFFTKGKCLNINNGKKFLPSTTYHLRSKHIWGANASLVIYNKKIIQKVGLFDPRFFAYEEDVDLSLRLNSVGYQTLLIPSTISYHLGGGTSRQMGYLRQIMDVKNWWLIIFKNYSLKTILLNFFPILDERLRNLFYLIRAIIKTDGLKSVYTLPTVLFKTYLPVFMFLFRN